MRAWYSGIMTAFQADETGSIPVARSNIARIVQLVEAPDLGSGCCGFESLYAHQAPIVKWHNASLVRMYCKFDSCWEHH